MSPLPSYRFSSDKPFPFQQTGLDIFASNNSTTYNKRYGQIFTCLKTGAVHLEMCRDLSSDKTLTALRRFFAKRGIPSEISSDNATKFSAAEKDLMTTFESSSMNRLSLLPDILEIQPAYAPHFDGVWERLIRSVKNSLYAIIGSKALTDVTFNTLLCEIQHFMKARPITTVPFSLRHRSPDP